jgi:hypothetical protein
MIFHFKIMPRTKITPKIISEDDLIDIKDAPAKFGRGWSIRSIYRKIENGDLVEGMHFIDDASTSSQKRIIKLIIPAIQRLRATARHER